MGASQTQICNLALGKVGGGIITDIREGTTAANACGVIFDSIRDEVLELRPWASCTKRAILARLDTAPAFEWTYAYQLKTDFLAVQRFGADYVTEAAYRIEGKQLLTNAETAYMIYTFRNTDYNSYEPSLVDLIATRMSIDLAMSVAGKNATLRDACEKIYEIKRLRYANVDGLATGRVERTNTSGLVESRS